MRNKPCKNDLTKSLHYIAPWKRSHSAFCSESCKNDYWAEARKIGEDTIQKDRRKRDNERALAQAKAGALVRVKVLPSGDQKKERWVSGALEGLREGRIAIRTRDGRPLVYDLGLIEVSLPLESRADALPMG